MSSQAPPTDRESTPSPAPVPRGYYWERTRRGALPLIVGALGLAGLGVGQLLPLRHQAESNLRVRSLEALGGAGLSGVNVDFTGQDGVLSGAVSSAADVDRALEIVRGLDGVRVARSELTFPGSGTDTSATGSTPPAEPTPTEPTPSEPTPSESASPTASASDAATASVTASGSPSITVAVSASPSAPAAAPSPTPGAPAAAQQKLIALPPVGFEQASSRLTPAGRATVARMASVLKASPKLKIKINGYTDDVGDWDVNLALSKGRAEAVRKGLIANGIAASRITSQGWSEERPKVPNTSATNRAINRRVEVVVS